MCAIAGFLQLHAPAVADAGAVIARMAEVQRHRGPDDGGTWLDPESGIALGHRRLSVVDLSPEGAQPMASRTGRYAIVFNGEIYNHRTLRAELDGLEPARPWRGHSDTETLLAAIERWGVAGAIERSVGMFAIGIWDKQERVLTLARDRMGEKPIYYGHVGGAFVFASELKAFDRFPGFEAAIDDEALGLYCWFNQVPAPRSIFRGVRKLRPGTMLTLDPQGHETERTYWTLETSLAAPRFAGSAEEAAEQVERLLTEAVRLQAVADVPVGAFLSGGIDSSAVVALMRENSSRVKTFSLGFDDPACDERHHARAVAAHLGTDHSELEVTAADALALIPSLPQIWDEPFADSSQIPVALVSRLAREQVTVSLSGDGGDELFCGYPSHVASASIEKLPGKAALAAALRRLPPDAVAKVYDRLPFAPGKPMTAARVTSIVHRLGLSGPAERFIAATADWRGEAGLLAQGAVSPLALGRFTRPPGVDLPTFFASLDARTYLPDDLLAKVDRGAMAVSLETRMPMLDHRLVDFAFTLPASIGLHRGESKWPLRRLLEKRVPRALNDRPKQGFSVPLATWLRGPLRDWADDLLAPSALTRFDATAVQALWRDHRAGLADNSRRLWAVLMFQAWAARR
ncbi:asparagine synthase (glutamine-hydrolyzing) [Sphingomonas sp. LB-2]|uniref:asparagine synthase (glutamine-hydrolyzing) n=1 Tax=Sphingomonas caeni TaxID=2984949 RepID=UPI0022313BF2|nr:asparagine synthase (glutamine-hydrolyzing) [Sphingomonas caeni]MCW3846633.1 asparagine synthase (glutamine-hydrolyzing) [Sphingomonas caeni]